MSHIVSPSEIVYAERYNEYYFYTFTTLPAYVINTKLVPFGLILVELHVIMALNTN